MFVWREITGHKVHHCLDLQILMLPLSLEMPLTFGKAVCHLFAVVIWQLG
jgi:hypothetical protein